MNQQGTIEKLKPYILPGICLVTFLCYINSLHNQFTNWDDDIYIALDPYIKSFTWDNLKVIFTKNISLNYCPPFTMLSFAVNYYFAQLNPISYYLTNILLHVANVALVFILAEALFSKLNYISKNEVLFIASLSALWFGIHPMHVESVSWIAERKDVLYTFFYLLGLISYLRYVRLKENSGTYRNQFLLVLVFFIASCLSKPMAVVFPLSLFLIDFLLKRKLEVSVIVEKIPVLLIALILGLITYHYQKESNAITSFGNIPLTKRAMFATYGFVMYLVKFFVPVHLSTFYPYPCVNLQLYVDMPLPLFYYFSFWIALLIIAIPFIAYKYKLITDNYFRIIVFGLGFFLVNVVFELQFISAGMAIMADRYSYVSYIGLFFVAAYFLNELINRFPVFKISFIILIACYTLVLAYLCNQRTNVWHNAESVFKDAIEQYGDQASLFYKGLGDYYNDNKEPVNALEYYARYVRLNNDEEVLNDMGNLYKSIKDYPNAAKYYTKLLHAGASAPTTLIKVSDAYATMGQTDSALAYYRKAVEVNPEMEKLYANIGTALMNIKQYKNAVNHYNVLVGANPENPYYYFYRGVSKFSDSSLKESISDFIMPLKLGPNDVVPPAAYNLSVVYDKLGDDVEAYKYAIIAKKAGQNIDTAFFNSIERKSSHQIKK